MLPGPLGEEAQYDPILQWALGQSSVIAQVQQKIVEVALSQRTELTGIELAQSTGMNNGMNPPRPIRKGGPIVLSYFEKAWPESYADLPQNHGERNKVLFNMKPLRPIKPEEKDTWSPPDWCGVFALWAIKTVIEAAGHGPSLGTWADARKKGIGINGVGGFRTRPNSESPMPGDVAFVKGSTGHQFVVHSFEHGRDGKIKRVFSIDGNSDNAAITTSAPAFQPGFDRKRRVGHDPGDILLYCSIL